MALITSLVDVVLGVVAVSGVVPPVGLAVIALAVTGLATTRATAPAVLCTPHTTAL